MKELESLFAHQGQPLNDEEKRIVVVSAHLSSAAVRFATVEEILATCELARSKHEEYKSLCTNSRKKTVQVKDIFDQFKENRRYWLHFLLRDNIGHLEPNNHCNYAGPRQDVIYALTATESIDILSSIRNEIKNHLTQNGLDL